jgi:hypothetical protein
LKIENRKMKNENRAEAPVALPFNLQFAVFNLQFAVPLYSPLLRRRPLPL